jgi:hypothetical protein
MRVAVGDAWPGQSRIPAPQPVTAKLEFSGDGDSAVDGDAVELGVIKVIDGDGETLDDDAPAPGSVSEVPEVPEVPESAPVPLVDDDEPADAVGATSEVVYVPLAE